MCRIRQSCCAIASVLHYAPPRERTAGRPSPLRIMWMISMPPKRVQAHRRSLNPSIGRVRRFIVGALRPDVDAREFIQQELISEGMVLVTRPGHPLANRDKVTLNDLNGVAWILPRDGTPARVLINGLFEQKNMATPAPTVETVDLAVIRGVLRCSDMVAAVSAQQLRAEIQSGELIVLDIDMPGTSRSIGLMWRNGSAPSPAALMLMSALRAVAMPGNPR
jgi:LysR family transcriptional regulator of gallate degradation